MQFGFSSEIGPESFAMNYCDEAQIRKREMESQRRKAEESQRIEEMSDYFSGQDIKNLQLVVEILGDGSLALKATILEQNISGLVHEFCVSEGGTLYINCARSFNKVFESLIDCEHGVKRLDMKEKMHNRYSPMLIFRKFVNKDNWLTICIGENEITFRNVNIIVMVEFCFMGFSLREKVIQRFPDLRDVEYELLQRTPLMTSVPQVASRNPQDYPAIVTQIIADAQVNNPLPTWTEAENAIEHETTTEEDNNYEIVYPSTDDESDIPDDESSGVLW